MSHTYIVPVTFLTFLKAVMSLVQKRTSRLQSGIVEVCEDYVGTWFETDRNATICDWHACSKVGVLLCMLGSACSL